MFDQPSHDPSSDFEVDEYGEHLTDLYGSAITSDELDPAPDSEDFMVVNDL